MVRAAEPVNQNNNQAQKQNKTLFELLCNYFFAFTPQHAT